MMSWKTNHIYIYQDRAFATSPIVDILVKSYTGQVKHDVRFISYHMTESQTTPTCHKLVHSDFLSVTCSNMLCASSPCVTKLVCILHAEYCDKTPL